MMPERIDWSATIDEWTESAFSDEPGKQLRLADPRALCTEWRNLAYQLREEVAELREENRRLRRDLERLTHPGTPWPFR